MTSTLPERPSAATSRENPEQADCAAQTGGELAAAPCSASGASSPTREHLIKWIELGYLSVTAKGFALRHAILDVLRSAGIQVPQPESQVMQQAEKAPWPCSAGEALIRAEGSLMVDLTGHGLNRAQFLKLSGIPLPGLRRRPDGLWEEVPWESYFESPQGRENPEQADCAAQTGGELAAAPCSAGVWFMGDIDHNWGGRYNELAMNVAASYRTMHDSLKPSCIIVRDNGQLSSTVLTDALLSHGLPVVRLYRTVGVRANNQPDVMSHPAIQFLGSMNNVENPVKCGWMISGWQCPTLNKVADGIGWEWRL